jgi:hypothetical protein
MPTSLIVHMYKGLGFCRVDGVQLFKIRFLDRLKGICINSVESAPGVDELEVHGGRCCPVSRAWLSCAAAQQNA